MATNAVSDGAPEPHDHEPDDRDDSAAQRYHAEQEQRRAPAPSGFFTIRKIGQGYWTRMGTAIVAALIIVFTAQFLFSQLKVWLPAGSDGREPIPLILGIVSAIAIVLAGLAWWITNKPTHVDFLIATDSEMKKVNWTSRRELIGSTRVVILFMFVMAAALFLIDVLFGLLFHLFGVLKTGPFGT